MPININIKSNIKKYSTLINIVISIVMFFCIISLSVNAATTVTTQVSNEAAATATSTIMKIDEKSFSCIREMTPVRHFYVNNLLGDIENTLAAANNPKGAIYPVGSVVQLVPTEVMVKRELGTFPATGDWEFFELEVNNKGSKITKRGFVDVMNRFGGNCFSCHVPAKKPWDFICESGHGCDPIPIDHKMTGALQRSDPRCGKSVPEEGDTMVLFKLKTMITIGLTKKWFEDRF